VGVVTGEARKVSKVLKRPVSPDPELGFCHRLIWVALKAQPWALKVDF